MNSNEPQKKAAQTERELKKELRASKKASEKYWNQLCLECRAHRADLRQQRFKAVRRLTMKMVNVAFCVSCVVAWCILVGYQTSFAMAAFFVVIASIGGGVFLLFRLYKKRNEQRQLAEQTAAEVSTSFFDNVVPNDAINWDIEAVFLIKK